MIHPTAIINYPIKLGNNVEIGPYTVIETGTVIEDDVKIQGHVRIGKDCHISKGCVIKWGSILTQKVELQENVFFGTCAVVLGSDSDRQEVHGTIIGKDSYIGAKAIIFPGASIAPDIIVGAAAIIRTPLMAKGTYVGMGRRVK